MTSWVKKHWEALAVGGVLGVVGLILWEKRSSASQTVVVNPTPPAPAPSTTSPGVTTLSTGQTTFSVALHSGDLISIGIPPGAMWTDNGQGALSSGNAPVSWYYQGPGTVSLSWNDANGVPTTTVVTLTNAP